MTHQLLMFEVWLCVKSKVTVAEDVGGVVVEAEVVIASVVVVPDRVVVDASVIDTDVIVRMLKRWLW